MASIGTNYYYDAQDLKKLKNFAEDKSFLNKLNKSNIKYEIINKEIIKEEI